MQYRFQVLSFADVSSAHLSAADKDLLTSLGKLTPDSKDPLVHANLHLMGRAGEAFRDDVPSCWFVAIGNNFDEDDREHLRSVGFSEEFAKLIPQLVAQRIFYVCFHPDGYMVDQAPAFDSRP